MDISSIIGFFTNHGKDILQAASNIIAGVSIIATFTKTTKDDTVLAYAKSFLARLLSIH